MNARISDDFTSLLYIAVSSSVFLYKLPIREVELDLSHTPPPPPTVLISHSRTSQLTVSVWGGGLGSGGWTAPPPRHKLEG
jgi:hypothetical protein